MPDPLLSVSFNFSSAIQILAIIILLIFSAFFSASETAFSTSNIVRIRNLADEKVKGARKALYIMNNFDKTLVTILIGNNLVNILNTTICASLFINLIINQTVANLVNTVLMTIIILTFGEILPKSIAKRNPEKIALRFSTAMFIIMKILAPLSIVFGGIQKLFTKKIKQGDTPTVTEDELETIIDTMQEEGVIDSSNADMIQGVLNLEDKTAYDIMTSRVDMVAVENLDSEEQIEKIKQLFVKTHYSRLPVYEGDKDKVIGILNQKDLFNALVDNKNIKLTDLLTEPLFVSENLKVDDLIRTMQKNKKHMAIVLDEHGGTSGLVCMEDALEEMVGEIYDEHDDAEDIVKTIELVDEDTYIIYGEAEVSDLFKTLGIEHLPRTEYTTVAGFIYELSENLPQQGMILTYIANDDILDDNDNYITKKVELTFTLIEVEDNRVNKVKLTVKDISDNEADSILNDKKTDEN